MPFYSYKCESCDHTFEEYRKIAEREPKPENSCPECEVVGRIVKLIDSPMISYGCHNFNAKVPEGFKDVLRTVKAGSGSGCTIDV